METESVGIVATIQANWAQIVIVIIAVRELAQAIVQMTPTDKDDKIFDKVNRFINYLILKKRVM